MIKEFKQLYEGVMPVKLVVIPLNPDEITDVERRQSLEAVNLIKEIINVIIKGRSCANGSNQNRYFKEE